VVCNRREGGRKREREVEEEGEGEIYMGVLFYYFIPNILIKNDALAPAMCQ